MLHQTYALYTLPLVKNACTNLSPLHIAMPWFCWLFCGYLVLYAVVLMHRFPRMWICWFCKPVNGFLRVRFSDLLLQIYSNTEWPFSLWRLIVCQIDNYPCCYDFHTFFCVAVMCLTFVHLIFWKRTKLHITRATCLYCSVFLMPNICRAFPGCFFLVGFLLTVYVLFTLFVYILVITSLGQQ